MSMVCKPIVFLDRDGTLNVDKGYVCSLAQVELIPRAADAVALLKQAGFVVLIVSNQSAVGRGMCKSEDVELVNREIVELLLRENKHATIDDIYYCPHHPNDNCNCRKPKIGMGESIHKKHLFLAQNCWVIGDKSSDLQFGMNLGIPLEQRILVLTGEGASVLEKLKCQGASKVGHVGDIALYKEDLFSAVEYLVAQS